MVNTWISQYNNVLLLAAADRNYIVDGLIQMGIESKIIDYNPKYAHEKNYICKDFIFDNIKFDTECIVHYNCEKTWPIGNLYKGDMILIGDNDQHNGDCNPIKNCEQLISQNHIKHIYATAVNGKHYIVYGSNIS